MRRGHVQLLLPRPTAERPWHDLERSAARLPCGRRPRLGGAHAQPDGPEQPRASGRRRHAASAAVDEAEEIFDEEGQADRVRGHPAQPRHDRLLSRGPSPGRSASTTRRPSGTRPSAWTTPRPGHATAARRCWPPVWLAEAVDLVTAAQVAQGSLPAPQRGRAPARRWRSAELADDRPRLRPRVPRGSRPVPAPAARLAGPCTRSSSSCSPGTGPDVAGDGWSDSADVGGRTAGGRGGSEDAAVAWLLAGRLALDAGRPQATAAARPRPRRIGPAPPAWSARPGGRREPWSARPRATAAACWRRAGGAWTRSTSTGRRLGSSELRALATRHGDELAALALRHAATAGLARCWSGASAGGPTALSQPPVHPPDDEELARDLAALRDTRRRLAEARAEGAPTASRLDEDRARLERAIRRRAHHLAGTSAAIDPVPGCDELVDVARTTRRSWSSSTSTACCTHWSPGPAGSPMWSWARRQRRSRRSRSPGSRCGRRPGDGPRTSTTSGVGCRWRCWGTPYAASVTGPWSSLRPAGCTPLPGRSSRR